MVPDKYFKACMLIFVFVNSVTVNSAVTCAANQYKVFGSNESSWCIDCPSCPQGQELRPICGSIISTNDMSECRPCEGLTFSAKDDVWSCMPCAYCADDEVVLQSCTKYSDIDCGKKCRSIDKYYDDNGACMSCSSCCGDEQDIHVKECQQKLGDASGKVCAFHGNHCKKATPTVAKQTTSQASLLKTITLPPIKGTTIPVTFMPPSDEDIAESSKQDVPSEATNKGDILTPVVSSIIFVLLLLVAIFASYRLLKGIRIRGRCGSQDIESLSKDFSHSSTLGPVVFSKVPSSDVDGSVNLSQAFMIKEEIKTQSPKKERPFYKKGTTPETTTKKSQEGQESRELLLKEKGSETWNSSYQDSKKLKSLLDDGSDLLRKICSHLDTPVEGSGGYDEIAAYYGLGYFERKASLKTDSAGPTMAMLVWLVTADPNLTIQGFIKAVKMKTKRNDVVQLLEKYETQSNSCYL